MRPSPAIPVSTPSLPVLRFLQAQSEQVGFFTHSRAATCQSSQPKGSRAKPWSPQVLSTTTRSLTTTPRHQATVESSLFNLDFLRPNNKHAPAYPFTFASAQRQKDISRVRPTATNRHGSTDPRPLLKRLWKLKEAREKTGLKSTDLPPLPSFLDGYNGANIGRNKTGKAGNELKLRCTEFDVNGNVTLMDGEFKKSELIAKYGLLPRDLRKIDSSLLPHILVRPSAILINLLHLRVLIKHNCVLVLDAYGTTDSYTQSQFMYDLQGKLGQKENSRQAGSLPYEFRAMEAVLISVTTGLEEEFKGVAQPVMRVLQELEEDIDREKLRHLLIFSKRLGTFEQKARLVRDAIDDILEADDDLVAMYLTERAQGKVREEDDHTEVEMLLESYHKVCDEIVQAAGNLVSNIRNTEEVVKAILDANRNSLMLLDLKFSIGTLGIGSGAWVASLYGMNVKNFLEESDLGFMGVTAWSAVFAAVVCAYGLKKLRKVQRVSMWGERGVGRRGTWRDVMGLAAPGEGGRGREALERRAREGREALERRAREGLEWRGREGLERGDERLDFRALEEAEAELPVAVKENPAWEKEMEKPAWLKEKEMYKRRRKGE